jgi:DNA-binding PadR family transcriptional regulator
MSLKYGLLGFLSNQPNTGYELHKLYPEPTRPTIAYIYRALVNMAREGLVEYTRVDQEKRPDRKVYRITDAGTAELQKWLDAPLHFEIPRNTLLVQIWFGSRIGRDKLTANIRSYRSEIKTVLDKLSSRRQWSLAGPRKGPKRDNDAQYRAMVYESVIAYLNNQIDWLDSILERIKQLPEKPASEKK